MKHIYIIGICGTFMGGLARLATEKGYDVSGSDANVYPPMSTQLEQLGITLHEGFCAQNVEKKIAQHGKENVTIIIGNSISRGNSELEYALEQQAHYTSGAQWLYENILRDKWVLAVAGTHGKTTTASLLAWILEYNQLKPGFLIGGVPENFGVSARLSNDSPFFVIEADEYDTAFSDKRSKFVHYHPRTVLINNLEFDHADIFDDLAAIQRQFHHLIKTLSNDTQIIYNQDYPAINATLAMGCWSKTRTLGKTDSDWRTYTGTSSDVDFIIEHQQQHYPAKWQLIGEHNTMNALGAIACAHHVGISVKHAVEALPSFTCVKRRLELIHQAKHLHIYDDFAHHPTAIEATLNALRQRYKHARILAIVEPRSNTMKLGIHKSQFYAALQHADHSYVFADATVKWDVSSFNSNNIGVFIQIDLLLESTLQFVQNNALLDTHIVIMSNGGFAQFAKKLTEKLPL